VSGEPGVGKSRLVREVARGAVTTGAVVLVGRCTEEVLAPYQPVVEALDHWVASVDDEVLDLQCPPVLNRLLPRLAQRRPSSSAATSRPSGSERWELFEGVVSLLMAIGEHRPVMVVIDDLHWADDSSALLLTHVLRRAAGIRLALVGTYRDTELDEEHAMARAIAELRRDQLLEVVPLRGLDLQGTGELFEAITGAPGAAAWGAAVHDRTGGNPLFVQQLGGHLLDSGALAEAPGPLPPLATPQGVREVVSHRLRRLSIEGKATISNAAVLGQAFDFDVLERVRGVDRDTLIAAVEEGLRAQLLVAGNDPLALRFAFAHGLVREAVYDSLSPPRRAELHRRAAQALESAGRGSPASDLAYHWLSAQDPARALGASARAAAEAEAIYGWSEAAYQYRTLLALWEKVPDAAEQVHLPHDELLRRAAEAGHLAGENVYAATLAEAAIREVEHGDGAVDLELLYERLGQYRWWAGDTKAAGQAYQRAVEISQERPRSPSRARVLASHGRILMVQDLHTQSEQRNREALSVAREVGDRAAENVALCNLGASLGFMGRLDDAMVCFEEARRLAEKCGSPEEVPRVLVCLAAVLLYEAGDLERAAKTALEGAAIAQEYGVFAIVGPMAVAYAADAFLRLGRWDDCERISADPGLLKGPPPIVLPLHLVRASLMMKRGQFDRAHEFIAAADQLSAGMPDAQNRGYFHLRQAELALWEQRFDDARHAVGAGLELVATADNQDRFGPEMCAIGVRAAADRLERAAGRDRAGEAESARSWAAHWADQVRRITRRSVDRGTVPAPDAAAFATTCEAECSRLQGNPDPQAWTAAVVSWEAARQPYPAAYARFRLAETLIARRQSQGEAAGEVAKALDVASSLGAEPLVAEIQRLVRRGHLDLRECATAATTVDAVPGLAALGLTQREVDVLQLLAIGKTNRQIASELFISDKTASVHVSNILRKLAVHSRFEAGAVAQRVLDESG
jgi:DNA-binding CsgD family transcriptional regulator/tetratricopeptide (TPR) repeat protein